MSEPIDRLRQKHRHCSCLGENCAVRRVPAADWNSHCEACAVTWPCDVIAAMDALEAESTMLRERAAHGVLTEEQITELGRGDGIYYVCQERAFAPGIADGWPDIIPAPHTKNGRLVKRVAGREGEE